jgi:hypothetical protein
MPRYDTQRFDPPAPMATVELRTQGKSLRDVPMLIDAGSDMSFLPGASVTELGLQADPQRRYQVAAFDGSPVVAESVRCDLVFLGQLYRGVYLILEAGYGILGRDILNHVSLVLDGPRLKWREEHALE